MPNANPRSSEYGTCQTVKAGLWPWLAGKGPSHLSMCSDFARQRSEEKGFWTRLSSNRAKEGLSQPNKESVDSRRFSQPPCCSVNRRLDRRVDAYLSGLAAP